MLPVLPWLSMFYHFYEVLNSFNLESQAFPHPKNSTLKSFGLKPWFVLVLFSDLALIGGYLLCRVGLSFLFFVLLGDLMYTFIYFRLLQDLLVHLTCFFAAKFQKTVGILSLYFLKSSLSFFFFSSFDSEEVFTNSAPLGRVGL